MLFEKIRYYLKRHWLNLALAVLVGLIYVGPQLVFIFSLGGEYQGIPMLQTANEQGYLGRIREIIDGYPKVSSYPFYEYKDQWPLMPPTGEMFYALPSLLLGISLVTVLIVSKFILPLVLFLLIYFFILKLIGDVNSPATKISATAGSLLILLGYDLVDYHSLWNFLFGGKNLGGSFLIWSRPVNPILGAIFLFSFLLCVWAIIQKTKYLKTTVVTAGLFLALMITSYFFSWGLAVSILGILFLVYLYKREYRIVWAFISIIAIALVLTTPYWYFSYRASQSPGYSEAVLRSGLIYTHYPLVNKLLLAVLGVYLILVFTPILKRVSWSNMFESLRQNIKAVWRDWHWFCLILILGSFWALNQQVITGITIWPYHFVQYSIPLAMIVLVLLWHHYIRKKFRIFWIFTIIFIIGSALLFGLYSQTYAYNKSYSYFRQLQIYTHVFQWLNKQPKDCVVLVYDTTNFSFNELVLAFSHCNLYESNEFFLLMPEDRIYHNYLVHLRLKGVSADEIENYIQENKGEIHNYLFSNWAGAHGLPEFPDFTDPKLEERIKKLPQDYRQFLQKEFRTELSKYKLDYILSAGPIPKSVITQLGRLKLEYQHQDISVYSLAD